MNLSPIDILTNIVISVFSRPEHIFETYEVQTLLQIVLDSAPSNTTALLVYNLSGGSGLQLANGSSLRLRYVVPAVSMSILTAELLWQLSIYLRAIEDNFGDLSTPSLDLMATVHAVHFVSGTIGLGLTSSIRTLLPTDMHVARLYSVLSAVRPAFVHGISEPLISAAELFEEDGHDEQEPVDLFEMLEMHGIVLPKGTVYEPPDIGNSKDRVI